jgi:hypothetical protein
MDSAKIVQTIGSPDSLGYGEDPRTINMVAWHYKGFSLILDSNRTLDGVLLRSHGPSTARGLCVGDPLSRVQKLYGSSAGDYYDSLHPRSVYYDNSREGDLLSILIMYKDTIVSDIYLERIYEKE